MMLIYLPILFRLSETSFKLNAANQTSIIPKNIKDIAKNVVIENHLNLIVFEFLLNTLQTGSVEKNCDITRTIQI